MPFQDLICCLNIAKLCAAFTSSLRLFQSRVPLDVNDLVPNLCDLAGRGSKNIIYMEELSMHIMHLQKAAGNCFHGPIPHNIVYVVKFHQYV